MACIERAVKCTSFDVEIMASVKYLENGDSGISKPCKYTKYFFIRIPQIGSASVQYIMYS